MGLVLAAATWLSNAVAAHYVPTLAAAAASTVAAGVGAPVPPTPTPIPTNGCIASAAVIAADGFDPYVILAKERSDVLAFYIAQGWNPRTQCVAIYDNWLHNGPDGHAPTTAAAFVRANGWAPATPEPTPTPVPDCTNPSVAARLGFDPYALLALHRPDVLNFYAQNPAPGGKGNWDPATQCVAIFDDWLKHPDGGPATTAEQYVVAHGWVRPPGS